MRARTLAPLLALLWSLLFGGSTALALEPPAEEPDSPRASLRAFQDLCRAGEYADAIAFLDAPDALAKDPDLARKLKAVLDRYGPVELEAASGASQGDAADKLPSGVDEVGRLRTPVGVTPVRLVKRKDRDGRWVFSRATVEQVPRLFGTLEDRWIYERLPSALTRQLPGDLLVWQVLALAGLLVFSRVAADVLARVVRWGIVRAQRGTGDEPHAVAVGARLLRPLGLFGTLGVFYLGKARVRLPTGTDAVLSKGLRIGLILCFFWTAVRVVEATSSRMLRKAEGETGAQHRSVVPLATTTAKIVAFLLALAATLGELGYEATSVVAGLGIGGLGLALAAQKTVEHLFGSISIGVDQPFKVGDLVKVDDVFGAVEHVGLRSTRVRTLDRTLVTFPNGKLADMKIESYDARDRIRLHATVGLSMSSTAAQVRAVTAGINARLDAHPKIWEADRLVRLKALGDHALDVEVMAWFTTKDFTEFAAIREEILLGFLEAVEAAGTTLAYPTRTLHVASAPRVAVALDRG